LSRGSAVSSLPNTLSSLGLSAQRKSYLHSKIRPYCPDYAKDILCPAPETGCQPEPDACSSASPEPAADSIMIQPSATIIRPQSDAIVVEQAEEQCLPVAKRKSPTCSYCKAVGHRNSVRNGIFTCPLRRSVNKDD